MDEDDAFYNHNPCPALDVVWERYNKFSSAQLQKLLEKIPESLPPKAQENRKTMLKTMLALRAIGVLHEPQYRYDARYGTAVVRP